MKKAFLALCLLSLFLMGSDRDSIKLVRLTIVNKSGLKLEVRLTGDCEINQYYLHVPEGNRQSPYHAIFTIIPDRYVVQPYYIELWDPVYGYSCSTPSSQTIDIKRNMRIVIVECDRTPRKPNEDNIVKFGVTKGGR